MLWCRESTDWIAFTATETIWFLRGMEFRTQLCKSHKEEGWKWVERFAHIEFARWTNWIRFIEASDPSYSTDGPPLSTAKNKQADNSITLSQTVEILHVWCYTAFRLHKEIVCSLVVYDSSPCHTAMVYLLETRFNLSGSSFNLLYLIPARDITRRMFSFIRVVSSTCANWTQKAKTRRSVVIIHQVIIHSSHVQ